MPQKTTFLLGFKILSPTQLADHKSNCSCLELSTTDSQL